MLKKIVVGADSLGKELKDKIKDHLASKGIEVMDVGINDCLLYTSPSPRDS